MPAYWQQTITWSNADLLSIEASGGNSLKYLIKFVTRKNVFQNYVCEIAAILLNVQCV